MVSVGPTDNGKETIIVALVKTTPMQFTPREYDRAMRQLPRWRAYFTNGERWEFHARDHAAAMSDAHFWAEFTGRELSALAGL